MPFALRKQTAQASALLTALFVVTVSAAISIAVLDRFRILATLAVSNQTANQSTMLLEGLQFQAMDTFIKNTMAWNKQKLIQAPTPLPNIIGPQTFRSTRIQARLIDGYSRYNINNLASANNQSAFINLLRMVYPKLALKDARSLVANITDWLSQNQRNTSEIYARYQPPYRAAHGLMVDISELRLVAGMTPGIYAALKPYIIALPGGIENTAATPTPSPSPTPTPDPTPSPTPSPSQSTNQATPININTASAPVLMTLSPNMTPDKAAALLACRRSHGVFLSIDDYNKTCTKGLGIDNLQNITTHSPFLLIKSMATTGIQQVRLNTLITVRQNDKTKRYDGVIVWQVNG